MTTKESPIGKKFRVRELDKYEPVPGLSGAKFYPENMNHIIGTVVECYRIYGDGDIGVKESNGYEWAMNPAWLEPVDESSVPEVKADEKRYLVVYEDAEGYTGTFQTYEPNGAENYGKKSGKEFTVYVVTKIVTYTPQKWYSEVEFTTGGTS